MELLNSAVIATKCLWFIYENIHEIIANNKTLKSEQNKFNIQSECFPYLYLSSNIIPRTLAARTRKQVSNFSYKPHSVPDALPPVSRTSTCFLPEPHPRPPHRNTRSHTHTTYEYLPYDHTHYVEKGHCYRWLITSIISSKNND